MGQEELNSYSIFFWIDKALFGNENTIKEFTLVFVTNIANLSNLSTREGDIGVIGSIKDDLMLSVLGSDNGDTWLHNNEMWFLTTQEVSDFNLFLVSDSTFQREVDENLQNNNDLRTELRNLRNELRGVGGGRYDQQE